MQNKKEKISPQIFKDVHIGQFLGTITLLLVKNTKVNKTLQIF